MRRNNPKQSLGKATVILRLAQRAEGSRQRYQAHVLSRALLVGPSTRSFAVCAAQDDRIERCASFPESRRTVAMCPPQRFAPKRNAGVVDRGNRYCRSNRFEECHWRAEPHRKMAVPIATKATPLMIQPTGIGSSGSFCFRIGVGVSIGRGPNGRS